jgi:hypothetical protein
VPSAPREVCEIAPREEANHFLALLPRLLRPSLRSPVLVGSGDELERRLFPRAYLSKEFRY